jgi:ring-1,2-phenylacetyl-CoA epoxidase subunit PaaB
MAAEYNKTIESLDPRITRANITPDNSAEMNDLIHFQTFEVFHQKKRGSQHQHVGIVHAPNADMALLYAKEQYARREVTANLWVAPSSCISATEYHDDDIFQTAPEKLYRNPASYKVMDRIKAFKERGMKPTDEV